MSKALYVGVDQVARRVTGAYVGVSQVTRRVTRGYVGVGGVARAFYALAQGLMRHGGVDLPPCESAVSTGLFALFANDYAVYAFDNTLTRHTGDDLSNMRIHHKSVHMGEYAIFMGGYRDYSGTIIIQRTVDAYNAALVRSVVGSLSVPSQYPFAARAGDSAVVAIGNMNQTTVSNVVNAYNATMTRSTPPALSVARKGGMAASVLGSAVFAGGRNQSEALQSAIDVYSPELVRTSPTSLSEACAGGAGIGMEACAMFAGGMRAGAASDVVEMFNAAFAREFAPPLSQARAELGATRLGDMAIFAGGSQSLTVDAYDATLSRQSLEPLLDGGDRVCGATVDNFALFCGGAQGTVYMDP